ncbi:MAG: hypothetical protein HKM86_09590, partial [Deltaproteobacteria bacterium]|nr:hypothetical protein [Deltaproteobacteria bacterium]
MRAFLLSVFLFFLAAPAWAVDHVQPCADAHEAGTVIAAGSADLILGSRIPGTPGSFKSVCYDTDGTVDSTLIQAKTCDNVDIKLFNMTDGAFADLSVIPRACPSALVDATTCNPIVADLATATNAEALGYATDFIYIDMVTNTNSDDVRVMIRC